MKLLLLIAGLVTVKVAYEGDHQDKLSGWHWGAKFDGYDLEHLGYDHFTTCEGALQAFNNSVEKAYFLKKGYEIKIDAPCTTKEEM